MTMQYNQNQLQEVLKDSRYQDIGALPSQNHGYDWDSLYIRPLEIAEYTLISKAAALGEMTHLTRAIDLCITQDAGNLTIGDYYYIMLWLRVHSMPKTPLVINWDCTASVLSHKETGAIIYNDDTYKDPDDITEYELIDCERSNTESVFMSNLNIMSLDEEGVEIPAGFDFPRARHIDAIRAALREPETKLLVPAAQWIAGDTFAQRLDTLLQAGAAGVDMLDTAAALNRKYEHGFNEIVHLNCSNCRARFEHVINPSPLTFFP